MGMLDKFKSSIPGSNADSDILPNPCTEFLSTPPPIYPTDKYSNSTSLILTDTPTNRLTDESPATTSYSRAFANPFAAPKQGPIATSVISTYPESISQPIVGSLTTA